MKIDPVLQQLLDRSCPSIQYRIRKELLGETGSSMLMQSLQEDLLQDEQVKKVFSWQQPDGWLGRDFHGSESLEAGIRILSEKGVEPTHPIFSSALTALQKYPERWDRGLGNAGQFLDENSLGGTKMISAAVLAYAGIENIGIVQNQIQQALRGFQGVLEIRSTTDLVDNYRKKLIIKTRKLWPSLYHLRLLAYTRSWRSSENCLLLANAVRRLIDLSPIQNFYLRKGTQLVAPASFCMDNFADNMDQMDDRQWMMWFQRMELLARTGVITNVPSLQDQVAHLKNLLENGFFTRKLSHNYFRQWNCYTGLMLEKDWKADFRRINDLTFRSSLLLFYSSI
jgi:hypothetical protein